MSAAEPLPREMQHFLLLSPQQHIEAIRRLHALGWSDYSIAAATRLAVEQVRRLLGAVTDREARR